MMKMMVGPLKILLIEVAVIRVIVVQMVVVQFVVKMHAATHTKVEQYD
jgi:hypothetical protein